MSHRSLRWVQMFRRGLHGTEIDRDFRLHQEFLLEEPYELGYQTPRLNGYRSRYAIRREA